MSFHIIENYDEYLRNRAQPYFEFKVSNDGKILFQDIDLREEWDYEPEVPDYEGPVSEKTSEVTGILPSTFVEFAVRMPDKIANNHSMTWPRLRRRPRWKAAAP